MPFTLFLIFSYTQFLIICALSNIKLVPSLFTSIPGIGFAIIHIQLDFSSWISLDLDLIGSWISFDKRNRIIQLVLDFLLPHRLANRDDTPSVAACHGSMTPRRRALLVHLGTLTASSLFLTAIATDAAGQAGRSVSQRNHATAPGRRRHRRPARSCLARGRFGPL
jgi:hypothetical protein